MRLDEHLPLVRQGGAEEINLVAIADLEAPSQLRHGHGKIAHGEAGPVNASEHRFSFLAKNRPVIYLENAARETFHKYRGSIEMAVAMKHLKTIALTQQPKTTAFHQSHIGLVQVTAYFRSQLQGCNPLIFLGKANRGLSRL